MKIGLVVVVMVICAVMQVSRSLQLPPKQETKQSPPYIEKRLVITAKKPQYFIFIPEGVFGVANWTFGPVFNNSVLQEVRSHLFVYELIHCLSVGAYYPRPTDKHGDLWHT